MVRPEAQSLDVFPGGLVARPRRGQTPPPRHASALWGTDLPMPRPKRLHPLFHQEAALAFRMRLRSNSRVGYRNVGLLSIGCAFRPGLRCRLTPGGRTWPGKPWDSGVGDSHPDFRYSCPHNHSQALQRSFRAAFNAAWDALLPNVKDVSTTSAGGLTPDHFRRGISRPVSCYALFKWWLPLSQHPGCPRNLTSLVTEPPLGALVGGLGCFPLDREA